MEKQTPENQLERIISRAGFTLLETIIVLVIVGILATAGGIILSNFRSAQALELNARQIAVHLRDIQQRSITQEEGEQWGIRFQDNGTPPGVNSYKLFKGIDFGTGVVTREVFLDPSLEFDDLAVPLPMDVLFSKITGVASGDVTIIIRIKDADCTVTSSQCREIHIDANGVVNY